MKIRFIMIRKLKYSAGMKGIANIMIVSIIITACNERQQAVISKKSEASVDSVKVFVLAADSVQKTITLPAELAANESAQIRAKIQGYIRKLNVDIGSRVSKGQVLALIDAPEINSRFQEINAKVKTALARYQSSKDYYDS